MTSPSNSTKKQITKEESIYKRFPAPALNNTNVHYLDQAPAGKENEPIHVEPNEVIFQDIEINKGEEMTVTVKNVTKKMKRIKIKQPTTNKFFCDYKSTGPLAPGLSMDLVISFKTSEEGTSYADEIWICPEGEKPIRLPLIAFMKAWHVVYPPFVNFGFLQQNKPEKKVIYFSNEGDNKAAVTVSSPATDSTVQVEMNSFEINPKEKKGITVTLTAQGSGELISKFLSITVGGEQREPISLNAVIVRQVLSVVFENGAGQTSEIDFRSLFFGEERECNAVLVNNGPKPLPFTIHIGKDNAREGENYSGDYDVIKAPREVGLELMESEMSVEPISDVVQAYSELPIKFRCRTKKSQKFRIQEVTNRNDEEPKSVGQDKSAVDYHVVAHLTYEDNQEIPIVMKAHAILPRVSLQTSIQFGECAVNERLDTTLRIDNDTEELSVPFEFKKIAHFHTDPIKDKLPPIGHRFVDVAFKPKNLGVFSSTMTLELVGGIYSVPIKLYGISRKIGSKMKQKRGPEATKQDFVEPKKFFQDEKAQKQLARRKEGESSIPRWLKESTTWQAEEGLKDNMIENMERLEYRKTQQQYNGYLKEERRKREQQALKKMKMKLIKNMPQTLDEYLNDVDLNLEEGRPPSPKILLTTTNDPLWVVKTVGKHEPSQIETKRDIEFDSRRQLRKQPYESKPKGEEQNAHCSKKLTGSELQKIFAGPIDIDFGNLFVNCEETRYFNIINDLHQFILVHMIENRELHIYPEQQVIPGGGSASFTLKFSSSKPDEYSHKVGYLINEKDNFYIHYKAQVEPVKLGISPPYLNFQFSFDYLERSLDNYIKIVNSGNWPAVYSVAIEQTGQAFKAQTGQNITIDKKDTKSIKVTYTPTEDTQNEEAKIIIDVKDGEKVEIMCKGNCPKGECELVEGNEIDFGDVQVGDVETEEKFIKIKNKQPREPAMVHVDTSAIPELKLTTSTPLRVHMNEDQSVSMTIACREQKQINGTILLLVRGGKTLPVTVKANVIVPNVVIEEEAFDFGVITAQGEKTMPITFDNKSNIQAILTMNLENERELDIIRPPNQNEKDGMLERIVEEKKEAPADEIEENQSDEEDETPVEEVELSKNYKIGVPANSKFVLNLKFTPDVTIHGKRTIPLPIEIKGALKTNDIRRTVTIETIQTKISLDPERLEFEDKVVTGKSYSAAKDLIIMNLQPTDSIHWQIKKEEVESDGNEKDVVWSISPYEGSMEPGGTMTLRVMFNPTRQDTFVKKVPLYVDNKLDVPYMEIEMRGKGTTPKLTYDKKEIIIPATPLRVESRAVFRVKNQGYENLDLSKYKVKFMDYPPDPIPVKLDYPEKTKAVNISKKDLKLEAVFKSNKPINMTGALEFTQADLINQPDTIDVSAVADNCILTVYSYILRYRDEITLQAANGTIELKHECPDSDEENASSPSAKLKAGRAHSKAGSTVSRTSRKAMTMIGYTPVQPEVRRKTCDYIKRWLNSNALSSSIQHFPQDLIKEHGRQLNELIQFLSGKILFAPPPPNAGGSIPGKDEDPDESFRKRFETLLTELTKYGAMLNTIRPEQLLSEDEYKRFFKKWKHLAGDAGQRFPYLSEEAWITLFFQIMKIFYLRRVTPAGFKALASIPASEKVLPPPNSSNIYSDSEIILLKWLEFHYNQQNDMQHRTLTNFESDLQDSLVFAAVIKSYCKNVRGLVNLKTMCKSPEDYKSNAQKITFTLKNELQLRTHITEEDILDPSAREMVLFCTQLFLYLPYYLPCETIEFTCTLTDVCTKKIELRNDNNVRINYSVNLEGSSDFNIGDKKYISIEPGKTEEFPVSFVSRISKPVEAVLMFNNSGDGPKQAAPMVFKLVSNVTKRVSVEVISQGTDCNLYEQKEIPIEVPNNFAKNARYNIEIKYEKRKTGTAAQKKKKGDKKSKEGGEDLSNYIPEPFYCKSNILNVGKGQTQTLVVIFFPFEIGRHRCYVVLIDSEVGELQFEIDAMANYPVPSQNELITKTYPAESRQIIEIPILPRNVKMESARVLLNSQCDKQRQEREKQNWENYKKFIPAQQQFEIKLTDTSGVFKYPNAISVIDRSANRKDAASSKLEGSKLPSEGLSDKNEESKLQIEFTAKIVKKYETKVIISNPEKTDIRIYELLIRTHPPPVFGQLTFNVPARQLVTQDIPINNESEGEWTIKVDLQYDKGQAGRFEIGRPEYNAPRKFVTNIQLKFIPEWLCEVKGKLTLNIVNTSQTFVYDLLGKGEEPLAESRIEISCDAKKTTKHPIMIKNDTDKVLQYKVETDMSKVLSGEAGLKIMPHESQRYILNITPLVGGVDMGSITFIDNEERYVWYVVELHVKSPEAEEEKPMQTYVRKPIAYVFVIQNPLNEPVTFDVDIKGEGLLGDPTLGVPANQKKEYDLSFAPLRAGEYQGYINFISEKAGEIKYKLALKADESPPQTLEFLEVELGKNGMHYAKLENPTKEEQLVISHNSNPTNYDVQEKMIIPPYSVMDVPIKYIPSNLDATESTRIIFESKNIGKWEFSLNGRGKLPTEMKPERITTTVGDTIPSSISFKNPLKEQSTIEITLEPSDNKEFVLLVKKPKVVLAPLSSYTIPYQFTPHSMTVVKATLVVSMSKTLVWRFPLEGDAEYLTHGNPYYIKCQSRKRSQETLKIQLPELAELKPNDTFSMEVVPKESNLAGLIDRSIVVELAKPTLAKVDDPLEFIVKFEPLRPFKALSELLVSKSSGGRWRFAATFEATEADVDDVIEIKSPLHKTSSVSFRLCNHTRTYADFDAFFTHDSATEFSVYPKKGVLEPFGKDGTNFIVSFTPTEYGKNKTGKLIIQTEEMQWYLLLNDYFRTYEIRGSHPEYKVPKPSGGRLDNKLTKDLESKLMHKSTYGSPKNFIRENIKKQKEQEQKLGEEKKKGGKSREPSPPKGKSELNISKSTVKK